MSDYVSRKYLREKWDSAKWDIENVLDIYNEDIDNRISAEDISRTFPNVFDKMQSVINELRKGYSEGVQDD